LLTYFALQSLMLGPFFPLALVPLYFKYHTLRYRFDEQGVSMRWGILFRREIYLTYRRIQDIHVSRNLFERWLGIGKVEVQTASGSSSAELVLEGMERYDAVRDYLYARMRGTKEERRGSAPPDATGAPAAEGASADGELVALLHGIRDELVGARRALEAREG
jgi:putative membrane protein